MSYKPLILSHLSIGNRHPPIFIAEMSGNHGGSLDTALKLVDSMSAAGAHGIKLQTYTADTMTIDCDEPWFTISEPNSPWKGEKLYDLYKRAATPWDWHEQIFERCKQHGMICFSTPFDETSLDFLEQLSPPCYKISSFECTDLPLIRRVAMTGKPMIISTGMANLYEIEQAVSTARSAGCENLILLKCTSSYPAPFEEANLRAIPYLQDRFGCQVGLSDHSLGLAVPIAAVAMGATLIEKHVTLDRSSGTVDSAFSLEPSEVKDLVRNIQSAWLAMGQHELVCNASEASSLNYRRSLFIAEDIKSGELFTTYNLRSVRPGFGLPPDQINACLGKKAIKDLKKGTPMSIEFVKD